MLHGIYNNPPIQSVNTSTRFVSVTIIETVIRIMMNAKKIKMIAEYDILFTECTTFFCMSFLITPPPLMIL